MNTRIQTILDGADDWTFYTMSDIGIQLNSFSRPIKAYAYARALEIMEDDGYHVTVALKKALQECMRRFAVTHELSPPV